MVQTFQSFISLIIIMFACGGQRPTLGIFLSQSPPHLLLRQGLTLNLELTIMARPPGRVPGICLSLFPTAEVTQMWHHVWLITEHWGSELRPLQDACPVTTLPIEPSKPGGLLWGPIRTVFAMSCYTPTHFIGLLVIELNMRITFWKRTKIERFWPCPCVTISQK